MAELLSPGQEKFAGIVSSKTGLELETVRAWVVAESGEQGSAYDGNPLNIMGWRNGERYRRDYGTPEKAAAATVALLRSNASYAPVLATARAAGKGVKDELAAIAASPWEENNYAGTFDPPGNGPNLSGQGVLLAGAYARLHPDAVKGGTFDDIKGAIAAAADAALGPVDEKVADLYKGVTGLPGKVESAAVRVALYLVLTAAALGLIVLGLTRAMGMTPSTLLAARAGRAPSGQSDEIPF